MQHRFTDAKIMLVRRHACGANKQPICINSCTNIPNKRPNASGINNSSIYSHLNDIQQGFEDKDIVLLDKEHKWFERGVKETTYVSREKPSSINRRVLRHNLNKHTTHQSRKSLKDSYHVTIQFCHWSLNRKKITRPHEASRMRCDT